MIFDKVGLVALGALLGWGISVVQANYAAEPLLGTAIRSISAGGVEYIVCIPPWDTRDAQGTVHHFGDNPEPPKAGDRP